MKSSKKHVPPVASGNYAPDQCICSQSNTQWQCSFASHIGLIRLMLHAKYGLNANLFNLCLLQSSAEGQDRKDSGSAGTVRQGRRGERAESCQELDPGLQGASAEPHI